MNTKVHVNGWDFNCRIEGEGFGENGSIVFVHGEIHGLDYWEPQFQAYADRYTCMAYDRRGHAGTGMPDFGFSVENQSVDLHGLIDQFGLERPLIVALAFGSVVAANFAVNHPDRVSGLALIAWSELYEAREYLARWEIAGRASAEALDSGGRDALVDLLREHGATKYYKVLPPNGHPFREQAIQLFSNHPADHYRRGMLEVASSVPDLIPRLEQLDIPIMGINGTDDPFIEDPARLAGVPNFRQLAPIEGAGRFAHWEKPNEFNEQLSAFFSL